MSKVITLINLGQSGNIQFHTFFTQASFQHCSVLHELAGRSRKKLIFCVNLKLLIEG